MSSNLLWFVSSTVVICYGAEVRLYQLLLVRTWGSLRVTPPAMQSACWLLGSCVQTQASGCYHWVLNYILKSPLTLTTLGEPPVSPPLLLWLLVLCFLFGTMSISLLCADPMLSSRHTPCLNWLGLGINLETIWLKVLDIKWQRAPQVFKKECNLPKDGTGAKIRDALVCDPLYVAELMPFRETKQQKLAFCDLHFVSQCCCSPNIGTTMVFIQHYFKCMQLIMWLSFCSRHVSHSL